MREVECEFEETLKFKVVYLVTERYKYFFHKPTTQEELLRMWAGETKLRVNLARTRQEFARFVHTRIVLLLLFLD